MKNLKIKLGLFSLLAVLAASVFLTSCEQEAIFPNEDLHPQNDDIQLASIKFNTDVTTDYLAELTDLVDIEFVEHKYNLGEETYSGFCNVSGEKKSAEMLNTLKEEFEIFVTDISIHENSEEVSDTPDTKIEIPENINFDDDKYYKIISVQVKGSDEALEKIEKLDNVDKVVRGNDADRVSANTESRAGARWYPNVGYTNFAKSSVANNRYVYSKFKWYYLTGIRSDWTYEHDVWLNNYNNNKGTYLSRTIRYSSSNMPSNYLDTSFLDGKNEVSYSMGTTRMNQLVANKYYTVYIRTTNGNINSDKFKLQPQQGYRTPDWCHSTWCIYSERSTRLIPAWNNRVPGKTWFWVN